MIQPTSRYTPAVSHLGAWAQKSAWRMPRVAVHQMATSSERLAQDLVARLEEGLLQDGAQPPAQESVAVSRAP